MNAIGIKTAIKKNAVVAVVAIGGGFVGSMIHDSFKISPTTIRAERFEVIGAGRLLSYWGPDSDPQIPAETPKGSLMVFMDTSGTRRCQIGSRIGDYGPELKFYGKDAKARVELGLQVYDDPGLMFSNRNTWRVLLGAIHGDAPDPSEDSWGLRLRSENVRSSIGAYRSYDGTYSASVDLADAQRRWSFPPDPKGH
jgi:hypothetical protein